MSVHDLLFYIFGAAMLASGAMVLLNRNPVNSAMCLVLVFFFMAGLFVLLEAFFLAAIQILLYAGAVIVLFLFVIMLLDIKASARKRLRLIGFVGGLAVTGFFAYELTLIFQEPLPILAETTAKNVGNTTYSVAYPLFERYLLPLQVTGLLLLVAMVGVVLLSRKEPK
jgi:NADH-quinone oxidoreductase subunit J